MRALAFVARRQGKRAMPGSEWANVMSLELGWMAPGDARRFVAAAQAAGLLVPDGDELAFPDDPREVEVPRHFRPDPAALLRATGDGASPAGVAASPQESGAVAEPSAPGRSADGSATQGAGDAGPAPGGARDRAEGASGTPSPGDDPFLVWVAAVADAKDMDRAAVLAEVAALQERMGGLLTAEVAVLVLAREADLDVTEAARAAQERSLS